MNRMIALWAHPRSRSTVLERVFIERGDFEVFHEPFAHMAFDEHSPIPQDNLDCGLPRTYEGIRTMLREARQRRHVFHKDMCYHCLDALAADRDFLREQAHVFIIREPGSAILSHHAVYPQMPREAIGHQAQYMLFKVLVSLTGRTPHVIDADRLARRPAETVARLCEYLQLDHLPSALTWERDCPPQWLPWRKWHFDAEQSTGIVAGSTEVFDIRQLESDPRLLDFYRFHLPFYEYLNQFTDPEEPGAFMKKIVVTGAANGIGRATVKACIEAGYYVIAVDKDAQGLQALSDDPRLETLVADLSRDEDIARLIPTLLERHGSLFGLVNNAGIYHGKGIQDYSDQEIEEIWKINLKSLACLSRDFALSPANGAPDAAEDRSRCIVNVASVAGEVGSMDALYGATKAGVIGLTKANAWNFGPHVRVNAVSPALIRDTSIHDRIPEHRRKEYERQEVLQEPILPDGVAAVILFLLSTQSRHMTGKVLPVDNGAYPR